MGVYNVDLCLVPAKFFLADNVHLVLLTLFLANDHRENF